MGKIIYKKENVLDAIAEYLFYEMSPADSKLPIQSIYDDIVKYTHTKKEIEMPKFLQARKMIIAKLKENHLFSSSDKLNTQTLMRLKTLYYDDEDIDYVIHNKYDITYYSDGIITCTFKLPNDDILSSLTSAISSNKKKSDRWGKLNSIFKICKYIKDHDPDNILAVIPECSRAVYIDRKAKIIPKSIYDDIPPVCNSLCMFVKNTPKGKKIIDRFKNGDFKKDQS
ncbi:MAG: hypothetical protein IJL67_06895 [Oscillospiraceae bacterium]|nr:hypothetical protein [Oscillospiraceae bacterium]